LAGVCRVEEAARSILAVLKTSNACLSSLDVLARAGVCSKFIGRLALSMLVRRGMVRRVPDYGSRRMCFAPA